MTSDRFIGRERELSVLESAWEEPGGGAVVVYGRRRVGKTELLLRFCTDRRSLFVECIQGSLDDNLLTMSNVMSSADGGHHQYGSLVEAMGDMLAFCREERTVVVFDEVPYLLSCAPQSASLLQHLIDAVHRETDSVVILCGSSISLMRKETTDADRPLYGRFGTRLVVGPMPYRDCAEFHPGMPDIDRLMLYLTVGGVPRYHLDRNASTYREYIVRHFLSPEADMSDEAENIVSAELVPRERHMSVLNAVSEGRTSLKDITDRTGLDRATCLKCISSMREIGILDTVHPMMGAPKRAVYRISDPIVAFCQGVIRKSKSYPLLSPPDRYDTLEEDIRTFLGLRFEDFCSDYVAHRWSCLEIGKWWGRDTEGVTHEIDIVATIQEDGAKLSLFGECKFTRRKVGKETIRRLIDSSDLTGDDRTRRFVVFSVSGFTDDAEDVAEDDPRITLVGLDDLTGDWGRRGVGTSPAPGSTARTSCDPELCTHCVHNLLRRPRFCRALFGLVEDDDGNRDRRSRSFMASPHRRVDHPDLQPQGAKESRVRKSRLFLVLTMI